MSNRSTRLLRRRGSAPAETAKPPTTLFVRLLAVVVCASIVCAAFMTAMEVFWRATGTPTILDTIFLTWSDEMLIMLGGALILAGIAAVHYVRQILE
ncbi:hypothetical protein [Burkholderia stabilis]|uniref:hypothetical protein n=1 Tax=Burkholderia stabilis TaxID=95485 RepID=UPI001591FC0C|nr:hypothetical protein [Burkholderia stabilis]